MDISEEAFDQMVISIHDKMLLALDAQRRHEGVKVNTMYKRKADKVHPLDNIPSDGSKPAGDPYWKVKALEEIRNKKQEDNPYPEWIFPKFSDLPKGSRLYGERLEKIKAQVTNTL